MRYYVKCYEDSNYDCFCYRETYKLKRGIKTKSSVHADRGRVSSTMYISKEEGDYLARKFKKGRDRQINYSKTLYLPQGRPCNLCIYTHTPIDMYILKFVIKRFTFSGIE